MNVYVIIERETGQSVTAETPLDALGIDSLEFAELLMKLAEETGKEVPDSKLAELHTVGDLARAFS
jgi:acyl carrier protein